MGVARTTVQALYEAARAKLADMLERALLHVEGGPMSQPRAGGAACGAHRARAARPSAHGIKPYRRMQI
ncbi:MAG: hypothetical protein ACLRZH_01210 [Ruthenibacterium lactatiformans]